MIQPFQSQDGINEFDDELIIEEDDHDDEVIIEDDEDDLIIEDEGIDRTGTQTNPDPASCQSVGPWKILIVDDDLVVHKVTQLALNKFRFDRQPLELLSAYSAEQAKSLIAEEPSLALILLDVVMETNDAGLHLVKHIRDVLNKRLVRIILRTGQPGEAPEASVIVDYDIHDYRTKAELTHQKLLTTVISGLRAYRDVLAVEKSRRQLYDLNQQLQSLNLQLEDYSRNLEQKVEERTQELQATQQELIQAEKMVALGQLVANIAHEVNTPLGAIRASIGNLSNDLDQSLKKLPQLFKCLSPTQQDLFYQLLDLAFSQDHMLSTREERQLRRQLKSHLEAAGIAMADSMAMSLARMELTQPIDPFLPLLTSEGGVLAVETTYHLANQYRQSRNITLAVERASKIAFTLKSYVHQDQSNTKVLADIRQGIDVVLTIYEGWLKSIELIKDYESIPEIWCYPDELNQVWTNLIHNAIQAMEKKGHLHIQVSHDPKTSGIIVQITDSGCGISPEIKEKIFEPFFSTKPAGEGSGLGLDIVKRIMTKHQGTIEVESVPGQTTFRVCLPCSSE